MCRETLIQQRSEHILNKFQQFTKDLGPPGVLKLIRVLSSPKRV